MTLSNPTPPTSPHPRLRYGRWSTGVKAGEVSAGVGCMEPLLQRNPGHTAATLPPTAPPGMELFCRSSCLLSLVRLRCLRQARNKRRKGGKLAGSVCGKRFFLKLSGKCAKAEHSREARLGHTRSNESAKGSGGNV